MTLPPLEPVAELAGYQVPDPDLDQVAAILDGMMADIQLLRDLELPDDIEPVLTFRVDRWD